MAILGNRLTENKSDMKIRIIIFSTIFVFLTLLGFHAAYLQNGAATEEDQTIQVNGIHANAGKEKDDGEVSVQDPDFHGVNLITSALDHMASAPLECFPITRKSIELAVCYNFVLFIIIAFWYVNYTIHKHDAQGIEKGSAKIRTDFKKFRAQYAEPVCKTDKMGNRIQK